MEWRVTTGLEPFGLKVKKEGLVQTEMEDFFTFTFFDNRHKFGNVNDRIPNMSSGRNVSLQSH